MLIWVMALDLLALFIVFGVVVCFVSFALFVVLLFRLFCFLVLIDVLVSLGLWVLLLGFTVLRLLTGDFVVVWCLYLGLVF